MMQIQLLARGMTTRGYLNPGDYIAQTRLDGIGIYITPVLLVGVMRFETYNQMLNQQTLVVVPQTTKMTDDCCEVTVSPKGIVVWRHGVMTERRHG